MSIRASELYTLPQEQLKAIEEGRRQIALARTETMRLKATGIDTSDEERQIAAMEAQLALFLEHFGPGSAARWARQAAKPK